MPHYGRVTTAVLLSLMAAQAGFGQTTKGIKEPLESLVRAQAEARQRFSKDLGGKTSEQERTQATDRFLGEVAKNTSEVLNLVRANPDDPAVVEACSFVIKTARAGPGDESYQAMEILLRGHVRDPGMGEVCSGLFYFVHAPAAESLLRSVMEKHPNRIDRAWACHTLATYLKLQARMVRRVREVPAEIDRYVHERHKEATERFVKEADPTALERESEALLERTIADYGEVKAKDDPRPLGTIAEGELFAMRNLSIGKVAPEIQGKDHEGKAFSLSDYRGKVVVLTFSGNWCGPCVGMYPQERELITKLKGKPFAMVSVNTDEDVATLKRSIDSGEVTWRCWWDEGTEGPITTRWGIATFPSIFVLDQAGVIRFKDVRGGELDRAVESLLEATQAK